jgi:hypothetical protein
MKIYLSIQEAASLLQSYGIDCHWHDVKKWAVAGRIKAIHENRVYNIDENDAYEFLESLWESNQFEIDETKRSRLNEYDEGFKKRIVQFKVENKNLQLILAAFEVKKS